jgi:hypothetical protein
MSSSTSARARAQSVRGARARAAQNASRETALTARELAWLAALPCAVLTVLAVAALGPLVGDVLLPGSSVHFFDAAVRELAPEPHEQGRFAVALAGPLLLAGVTALLTRRGMRVRSTAIGPLVWMAQAAVVGFAVACLFIQRGLVFAYPGYQPITQQYFTDATLVVSLLGTCALLAGVRSARVRGTAAHWMRETRARRVGWTLAAALLIAVWLLHAFNTEHTIVNAAQAAAYHVQFTLDETFAVLNGRSPLVDFAAQYGSLWPYPIAAVMSVIGASVTTFSALMCIVSGVALLAMYDVLRRVARSSLAALVLFAPFLATSFFLLRGPLENRYTLATIFADYPLRFAGPWALAWLTTRQLDRAPGERAGAASGPWPLFLVAGLVVLNNADHGVPALTALVAALVWAGGPLTRARLGRLALHAAAGLAAAYALVALLTLARAGALPDLALLVRFARLFALAGYAMLPMPVLGLHTVVYITFAAALALATVRALEQPDAPAERALTGALAFIAVFGLASGTYYAGRSHPEVLVTSFAAWSFALALLTLVVVRQLAAHPRRRPGPAAVGCLLAFCVAACSLAQTPTPWSQLDRLRDTSKQTFAHPGGEEFVAAHVHRGERVAILLSLGHRMAENLGVEDVTPYTGEFSMPAVEQLADTIRILRAEGGRKVVLAVGGPEAPDMRPALQAAGFAQTAEDREGLQLWTDGARSGPGGVG